MESHISSRYCRNENTSTQPVQPSSAAASQINGRPGKNGKISAVENVATAQTTDSVAWYGINISQASPPKANAAKKASSASVYPKTSTSSEMMLKTRSFCRRSAPSNEPAFTALGYIRFSGLCNLAASPITQD